MFGFDSLTRPVGAVTHLVTAENVYGKKGAGGMAVPFAEPQEDVVKLGQNPDSASHAAELLGRGWKVRPCIRVLRGQVIPLMDVDGPGVIEHIWVTCEQKFFRSLILRIYWDGCDHPSVETPLGDFFCCGWSRYLPITSLPMNCNPTSALNCYFPMPFRRHARITIENRSLASDATVYYAVSYAEKPVPEDELYFCARFRRTNPLPYGEDYVIADGIRGKGKYVGTQLSWQQNHSGWWGEGEVKAYIDGDNEFPTYCGTGTEDYFGGAWSFNRNYSAPFLGYTDLSALDGRLTNQTGNRHTMYRFHIPDPIFFEKDLKVTIQAIGWREAGHYLVLQDDISSVAYWYQTFPNAPFEPFPPHEAVEVV